MSKSGTWRLIVKLAATAVASPLVVLLLVAAHGWMFLLWLLYPFVSLGHAISTWINAKFPPQGGGWFQGLTTGIAVDSVIVCCVVWMILFCSVQLLEKLNRQKKREE